MKPEDLDDIISESMGRGGSCNRCGLCCLIAEPVRRVPKRLTTPPAHGEPPTEGPDARLYWEREGYAVGLETTAYWFMMRWDPCPHLSIPYSNINLEALMRTTDGVVGLSLP